MNIVEAARKMRAGQFAHSKEVQERIMLDDNGYWFFYVDDEGRKGLRLDFNKNEWDANDWEIEIQWVDFWTAWQARINEKKKIRSEHWHETVHIDANYDLGSVNDRLTEKAINGKWQIIE